MGWQWHETRAPDGVGTGPSAPPLGGMGGMSKPAAVDLPQPVAPKIQAFEQKLGARRHEDTWNRTPNSPGTGAIHVKTFHCKLNDDAIQFLDQQVNEWLDAHPQYEVKMATTNVGEWTGKLGKESHLIVTVWV